MSGWDIMGQNDKSNEYWSYDTKSIKLFKFEKYFKKKLLELNSRTALNLDPLCSGCILTPNGVGPECFHSSLLLEFQNFCFSKDLDNG